MQINRYSKDDIIKIEDISDFVKEQHQHILNRNLGELLIPEEKPYLPKNDDTRIRLKIKK